VRYTLGDGIIVANLVPLCQVLAGNYRPLTAQLVTFLTLCCLFNIRQISNNILAMPWLGAIFGAYTTINCDQIMSHISPHHVRLNG